MRRAAIILGLMMVPAAASAQIVNDHAELRNEIERAQTPGLTVALPPPELRPESPPPPPGPPELWAWHRGHWRYFNNNYVWITGHWVERPQPNSVWVDPVWLQRGGTWTYMEGHWQ